MEIKYKLYPYPVLSSYSNDYGTGAFDVAIDIVRDGYDLRIDFLATLTCQSLQDCIKQGVAKFVYHLECSQTGFRTVVQTDKVSEVYTLNFCFQFGNGFLGFFQKLFQLAFLLFLHHKFLCYCHQRLIVLTLYSHLGC